MSRLPFKLGKASQYRTCSVLWFWRLQLKSVENSVLQTWSKQAGGRWCNLWASPHVKPTCLALLYNQSAHVHFIKWHNMRPAVSSENIQRWWAKRKRQREDRRRGGTQEKRIVAVQWFLNFFHFKDTQFETDPHRPTFDMIFSSLFLFSGTRILTVNSSVLKTLTM